MKQKISTARQNANAKLKLLETFGDSSFDRHYFAEISDNPLTGAFKKKTVVHAGLGSTPVPQEKTAGVWHTLSTTQRRDKTCAYIHIPFCSTHCLYCGFFTNPAQKETMHAYAKALIRELEADQDLDLVQSHPVNAVYLGGGTPTALDSDDLRQVLDTVRRCLPLANDCEITVEGRINDLTDEKIQACIKAGANRFSLGVQSFDTDIRTSLGRLADRQTVIESLLRLKQTNHAAIIIDLIFGLPDQTMAIWEKDIDILLDIELDGVDLYQLIRFPGGRLDKAARSGRFKTLADQAQRALMFESGVTRMTQARYRRLSISHWGRKFRERNIYNLAMKEKTDCLAYGSGAGGSVNGHMIFLDGNLDTYLETAGKIKPVTRIMTPPAHDNLTRLISGSLELGYMDLRGAGKTLGLDLETIFAPLTDQWESAGLITREQGWITLTLAGQFWQTNLAQGMIDYYKEISTTS
ncbi:heme anaerobic degradation radical SAM methyltransferase ChuW/HutW [Desulfobacter hydrogenophilus]|uniref:Heme anaerobic degradation radical SAM methyltransferase ChuW/HutW n=1 Tax=Desulfobacter hydrogenophilus TaxID=2291 RepID=A0A328FJE9_9BACT|nr:heme anaerobic degradation radical SAM methyltransferase ChuW/HutW [Desulfobacter hydrogenophilus]NDY70960.1 heme anaerobic degradation radical SAM methyltransferase ChuW/HutW [Desulfobacter hydrogenophilus]QBH12798.1 heme anaerobic degradation radical SAM methyltransferase ChuW/HutW [Desulfobacter hydrogenophilus]RAM03035.1 heme anaerobic degradation radical SAM methyltransferase ChuW/HutW [Desulfobacter hydrogenophilus]